MCLKGLASDSWQKGSLLTVQISVSCMLSQQSKYKCVEYEGLSTYRLEVLLDLGVEGTSLEGNDLRGGIGVVGDGRATLGAEEAVDDIARAALGARVLLDGAVNGQLVLRDDGDES
jgi:hypothetical protein